MNSVQKVIHSSVISGGIVMGVTRIIHPGEYKVPEIAIPASKIESEIDALNEALSETVDELTELRDSASKKMGGPVAKIFDAQLLIATDEDFLKRVHEEI
jgi:phosphoenolpyruvate-protein kinase (PTS system EI component)